LYDKKAIAEEDLLPFLTTWLDQSSGDCMFSPTQLKNWTSSHLQACPWYLECNFGITPPEEEVLFQRLKDSTIVNLEFDEFAGLNPEARAKVNKRWKLSNKKKVNKLDITKKKTKENKKKRLAIQIEKEQVKDKKKGTKRKVETPMVESATSAMDTSSGFNLTQGRLVHGLTPTTKTLNLVPDIDECIMNLSLASLNPVSKAFDDMVSFLDMVNPLCPMLAKVFFKCVAIAWFLYFASTFLFSIGKQVLIIMIYCI